MKLQRLATVAILSLAGVLANGGAFAAPSSGCVQNELNQAGAPIDQICNLYEFDSFGSPSEVSSANSIFTPASWDEGYVQIFDPATVGVAPVLSDVLVFSLDDSQNDLVTLYSFDDGGGAPPGFPGFTAIGDLLGSVTEDSTGFATWNECYAPDCGVDANDQIHPDIINVFSPPEGVPEPVTLSLLGAGLVGAAALRRRRGKL